MRHRRRCGRALGYVLAAALLLMGMSPPLQALEALPARIDLRAGDQVELPFGLPGGAAFDPAQAAAVARFDERPADDAGRPLLTAGSEAGETRLTFRLLGLFPVRRVQVSVGEARPKRLVPGGQSIGVALLTEGVVVVGASDLGMKPSPARVAGLRAGDRIVAVNGTMLNNAAQLAELIEADRPCQLEVVRDAEAMTVEITPTLDNRDGACRLGMWVRDSTAGIGTLSYYDPDSGRFGALGHAVADVDTGIILPVRTGEIYKSSVTEINKGRQGAPGELLGEFLNGEEQWGEIGVNTESGIFGAASRPLENPLYPDGLPVAARQEVRTGPAELLTTLTDGCVSAYACEIERVDAAGENAGRSMLIHITDPALIEATGGIVQGMSGSPIIQNGKLIGAVTHVLINDPTRGYGIFIENMLEAGSE